MRGARREAWIERWAGPGCGACSWQSNRRHQPPETAHLTKEALRHARVGSRIRAAGTGSVMTGKVAIITGASGGIGAGLVAGYRGWGWAVVASASTIKPSEGPEVLTVEG